METDSASNHSHVQTNIQRNNLLPFRFTIKKSLKICKQCAFVNNEVNNYCINCGYPLKLEKEFVGRHHYRLFKRDQFLNKHNAAISRARNTLYVFAAICLMGFFFIFSNLQAYKIRGAILIMLSAIYYFLAKWTKKNPFISLLVSFIILSCFILINTWAEMKKLFPSATGIYLLIVQFTMFYYLFKGMEAAYHKEVMEEHQEYD